MKTLNGSPYTSKTISVKNIVLILNFTYKDRSSCYNQFSKSGNQQLAYNN